MLYSRYRDLQSMCLHAIAANIKIFVNNSHIPQMHIEFLHRAYAEKLLPLVMSKGHISEIECTLWFLTPCKKQVTLRSLRLHTEDILNKIHAIGSLITSLNLTECFASVSIFSALICCVPNVKCLILRRTPCTDQILLLIMKMCPSVITLDLKETEVTNEGIEELCTAVDSMEGGGTFALKNLDVTDTRVTKKGIILILKYMPYLEILRHEDVSVILYELHDADAHNCDETVKYNLTEFMHFSSVEVDLLSVLKVWTILCPNIRSIIIEDFISEMDVSIIKRFTQLRDVSLIYLGSHTLTAEAASMLFVQGEMLSTLCLVHGTISIKTLVQCCKNLKSICFQDITYEDFAEQNLNAELNPLDKLTSLTVKHFDISASSTFKSISLLISLSHNLRELCISFAKNFSEEFTQVILNSSSVLWSVDFSFTDIKIPSLLHLFKCKTVERIRVDSCVNICDESDALLHFLNFNYKRVFSWQVWDGIEEYDENDDTEKLIDDPFIIDFSKIEY